MKLFFKIVLVGLFGIMISNLMAQNVNKYEDFDTWKSSIPTKEKTTYVVNFWATWCKPCVAELPYFEALQAKRDDVEVILVSLDFERSIDSQLIPFLKRKNIQSRVDVLLDPHANEWINKVNPDWSGSIPATLIIKGDEETFYEKSFESIEELESIIE